MATTAKRSMVFAPARPTLLVHTAKSALSPTTASPSAKPVSATSWAPSTTIAMLSPATAPVSATGEAHSVSAARMATTTNPPAHVRDDGVKLRL